MSAAHRHTPSFQYFRLHGEWTEFCCDSRGVCIGQFPCIGCPGNLLVVGDRPQLLKLVLPFLPELQDGCSTSRHCFYVPMGEEGRTKGFSYFYSALLCIPGCSKLQHLWEQCIQSPSMIKLMIDFSGQPRWRSGLAPPAARGVILET
ncbi:uncharacterized protein LOC144307822 [Canis aureus]